MSASRYEPSPDAAGGVFYPLAVCLLVVGLLLGFALLPRLFNKEKMPDSALIGKASPEFSLPVIANGSALPKDADGQAPKSITVASLHGKVAILDFWATWCGPCNIEAPILDQVAKKYADRGLVVVGVSQDNSPGLPAQWTRSKGISYPMIFDDTNASNNYGVDSLPTMVILDRNGVVHTVLIGISNASYGELSDIIDKIL